MQEFHLGERVGGRWQSKVHYCVCTETGMLACGFGLGGCGGFLYFHFAAYLIAQ